MQYFWLAALTLGVFIGSAHAQAPKSIQFGSVGAYSQGLMHVFVDASQEQHRCPCHRFSVAVDDGDVNQTRIERIVVMAQKANGELVSSATVSVKEMEQQSGSPSFSPQLLFRKLATNGNESSLQFQVLGLRRACSDLKQASCRHWRTSIQGEFNSDELALLAPVLAQELFTLHPGN